MDKQGLKDTINLIKKGAAAELAEHLDKISVPLPEDVLHIAEETGDEEVTQIVLDHCLLHGFEEAPDMESMLHYLLSAGYPIASRLLALDETAEGAKVTLTPDAKGRTQLDLANMQGFDDVAEIIMENCE